LAAMAHDKSVFEVGLQLTAVFQSISYICQFAMCGIKSADQWQAAQALYVIGSLGGYRQIIGSG
jgi:hypothetical protein